MGSGMGKRLGFLCAFDASLPLLKKCNTSSYPTHCKEALYRFHIPDWDNEVTRTNNGECLKMILKAELIIKCKEKVIMQLFKTKSTL